MIFNCTHFEQTLLSLTHLKSHIPPMSLCPPGGHWSLQHLTPNWGFPGHLLRFIGLCLLLLLVSPDVNHVLLEEVVPLCTYIAWFVIMWWQPHICNKCCRVIAHHCTLDDDSEHPMDYELSLFLKVFPLCYHWLKLWPLLLLKYFTMLVM